MFELDAASILVEAEGTGEDSEPMIVNGGLMLPEEPKTKSRAV